MKFTLLPMRLMPRQNRTNQKNMARLVEKHGKTSDLLVFPQIEIYPDLENDEKKQDYDNVPASLYTQADIVSGFSAKKRITLAAGFFESLGEDHYTLLALADRTGQIELRTRKLTIDTDSEISSSTLVKARIQDRQVAFCLSDDLFEENFPKILRLYKIEILVIPAYLVALESEVAKVVRGEAPEAVEELLEKGRKVAVESGAYVAMVNSYADEDGPCGGGFIFGPDGKLEVEIPFFDENPVEYEIL
ncbi:MAG: hypothetical protein ACLFQ6_07890 [Candidatus Sumerlaeia bacterium]